MLLVLEVAAGIVIGVLVLVLLAKHGAELQRNEMWRRADLVERARRDADRLAHHINTLRYWEKQLRDTPKGFDDGTGWVSPAEMNRNVEYFREGLKRMEDGTYSSWSADQAAAIREKLFAGLQPDPSGQHRFRTEL